MASRVDELHVGAHVGLAARAAHGAQRGGPRHRREVDQRGLGLRAHGLRHGGQLEEGGTH